MSKLFVVLGTKLLLNAALKNYVTVTKAGDKMFRLFCLGLKEENSTTFAPATYLFKLKNNEEADSIYNAIKSAVEITKTAQESQEADSL